MPIGLESLEIVKPEDDSIYSNPTWKGKLYGIELEIEAEGLYSADEVYDEENEEYVQHDPIVPKGWLREQEDSIIGVELISDKPYDYQTSVANIVRVFEDINRQGFVPTRTPRGSTHIHANISDLTWDQMKSFVVACAWAEPTLIELAGKGRKGNLFAQSYETTPLGWEGIIKMCRQRELLHFPDTHYMATSFHPVVHMGSVEFRMGPSSRNISDALIWLDVIDWVVSAGRETKVTEEYPIFMDTLLEAVHPSLRTRLREKGARQAQEVFSALQEPYTAPQRPEKKSLSAYMEEYEAMKMQVAQAAANIPVQPMPADMQWFSPSSLSTPTITLNESGYIQNYINSGAAMPTNPASEIW